MRRSTLITAILAIFAVLLVGERVLAGVIQCAAAHTCPKE